MTDLWAAFVGVVQWLHLWLQQPANVAIVSVVVGVILTRLVPFLYNSAGRLLSWLGRLIGGRFAYRSFEKNYLDWVVTQLKELKLTGIVSQYDTKKPQLERVFVALHIGERGEPLSRAETLQKFCGAIEALWQDCSGSKLQRGSDWHALGEDALQRFGSVEPVIEETRTLAHRRSFRSRLFRSHLDETALLHRAKSWISHYGDPHARFKAILREHSRLAILGGPGSGKTTLLQYVALAYARERAGDPKLRRRGITKERLGSKKWRLPLFIPLGTVARVLAVPTDRRTPSIIDALPSILPPDLQSDTIASRYFVDKLDKGDCIVLLDGLDEVPTEAEFLTVVRAIESLALRYKENQFLVTSRISGWRTGVGADFETFYLNDMTDEQIETFIDQWYSAVENAAAGYPEDEGEAERKARKRRAAERSADLKQALRENLGIRRLATNPMLLSIIALVHRSLATLPKERSKLYAECSKILLEQWDVSRGVRVDDTNLKLTQKEAVMRELAFAIHQGKIGKKEGGREASRAEVESLLAGILPSLGRSADDAARLLKMLIERSGLITERQRDVLVFAHHTFQEYFTAQYLAIGERADSRDFLASPERICSAWWHEVILLYVGLLSDASHFIRLIYNPVADDIFRQRLQLAGPCLGEAVGVQDTQLRHLIAADLLRVRMAGDVTKVEQMPAPEVLDYLIQWSKSQMWYAFAAIATSKQREGLSREIIQDQLLVALESGQSYTCIAALAALEFLRWAISGRLVTSVVVLTSDRNDEVRLAAVKALGLIPNGISNEKEVVLALVNVMRHHPSIGPSGRFSARLPIINESARALSSLAQRSPSIRQQLASLRLSEASDPSIRLIYTKLSPIFAEEATASDIDIFVNQEFLDASKIADFKGKTLDVVVTKLIDRLKNETSSYSRAQIVAALSKLSGEVIERHGVIMTVLICLLSDKNKRVRDYALSTLRMIASHGLALETANEMLELLGQNGRIQMNRTDADSSPPKTKETVVRRLIALTRDERECVRALALNLLGLLGIDTLSDVVEAITVSLDDGRDTVRCAAAVAVTDLGEKAATLPLVEKLAREARGKRSALLRLIRRRSLLHDPQKAAIAALGVAGWLSPQRSIETLCQVVREEKFARFRWYERYARFELAERYAPFELAERYASFELGAIFPEPYASWDSALESLRRLGSKIATEQTFDTVLDLARMPILTDLPDFASKRFAAALANVLAELAKSVPPSFAINRLTTALAKHGFTSRFAALTVLGRLGGEIIGSDPVTTGVLTTLEDDAEDVRIAALDVANVLVQRARKETVEKAIMNRLGDRHDSVREKAWEIVCQRNRAMGYWTA